MPRIWFGGWTIGGWHRGPADDSLSLKALHTAQEHGILAVDTAPVYGFGHSEELIGRFLKELPLRVRESVFVATKCGLAWNGEGQPLFHTEREGRAIVLSRLLSRDSILRECDASLARLGIDRIDLYQIHWPASPLDDALGALEDLKRAGKIRYAGLCNTTVEQILEWKRLTGRHPVFVQERYNLIQRKIEAGLLPYLRKHGIPLLAYSPLAQGALSGRFGGGDEGPPQFAAGDERGKAAVMNPEYLRRIEPALHRAREMAAARKLSLSQLCIAWVLSVRGVTAAISGIRTPDQAVENALANQELTEGETAELGEVFRPFLNNAP